MGDIKKDLLQFTKEQGSKIKIPKKNVAESLNFGKVPPQAPDLEEAILGALMLEKNAVTNVIDILHPEAFYFDKHKIIFNAIRELFHKSIPIDILTVTEELKKRGELEIVGGAYYLSCLTSNVVSAAHIEYHARIVIQKYIQRKLIEIASHIIKKSYEESTDVFDLLDEVEREIFAVSDNNFRNNLKDMPTLLSQALEEIEQARKGVDKLTGIPSGFTQIDRITWGWQNSDLIIIAARPGMGKTSFALSLARNIAVDFKYPVAIFSLEQSALQLVHKLISSETEINAEKLKRGQLKEHEWIQLVKRIENLENANIFIDDTPALSIFELRARARRLKHQYDIKLIIIDYLQLMEAGRTHKGGTREQDISTISRSLKSIAKELNIPVISLAQLSRDVEKRGGSKRPQLSDLRESGAIEQDADMVFFIYRPEYYGLTHFEDNMPSKGIAEILIAKNRHGKTARVRVRFIPEFTKFVDIDEDFAFDDTQTSLIVPSKMNEEINDDDFLDNTYTDDPFNEDENE